MQYVKILTIFVFLVESDVMKRIAMLTAGYQPFDQSLLAGVRSYSRERADWTLRYVRLDTMGPRGLKNMESDGILIRSRECANAVPKGIPHVYTTFHAPEDTFAVSGDDAASGRLVAKHFRELHIQQWLFFWNGVLKQSESRWRGFKEEAEKQKVPCQFFLTGPRTDKRGKWILSEQLDDLADVLRDLPKPIGLYAADDAHGDRALQACQLAGLRVPDDVAIVCHSVDTMFCEMTEPPLSSVAPDPVQIGYEAAKRLDQLINGYKLEQLHHYVPPQPVVVRASSNFVSVSDPLVNQALRVIRDEIEHLSDVDSLLDRVPASRSTLERHFRDSLGRTPAAEIRRARLQLTKQLLRETEKPLTEIAMDAGFGGIWQLCRQFKPETGLTPTQYRKQFQQR